MTVTLFDDRPCHLGEGPLWHPRRRQLFWFDIMGKRLMSVDGSGPRAWSFDEPVSAAGWIDDDSLLVASASGLWRFDIGTGARSVICALEANNPATRSNDGRADPWGGFWIGTMAVDAAAGAGAIYRFYKGDLRQLFDEITIPNAICFAPDRSCAYFTDTATQKIMKTALNEAGWPSGAPEVFIDLTHDNLNPDGAIVDAAGQLWVAFWGDARVAAYDASGTLQDAIDLPADHVTCPAFGGADLGTLFVTSARQGLTNDIIENAPQNGMTFALAGRATGLPEPQVLL